MFRRIAVVTLALLLLAGCSSHTPQLAPSPLPTYPGGVHLGPKINTQSAALGSVRKAVMPTQVQIPSVKIDVQVNPVGIGADGLMEIPPDVAIAGWYKYGSDPGSATGTTVIAAHVSSYGYGVGPFAKLQKLAVGAPITVTSEDGSVQEYAVESVQKMLKTELPLDQVFDREGAPRLALITCGGQYNYDTGHYTDNVVVVATPVAP